MAVIDLTLFNISSPPSMDSRYYGINTTDTTGLKHIKSNSK
jgi:hypothetical protein